MPSASGENPSARKVQAPARGRVCYVSFEHAPLSVLPIASPRCGRGRAPRDSRYSICCAPLHNSWRRLDLRARRRAPPGAGRGAGPQTTPGYPPSRVLHYIAWGREQNEMRCNPK